jgi:hypothetical protein
MVVEHFLDNSLQSRWQPLLIGSGQLKLANSKLVCSIGPGDAKTYHDAQISDYAGLRRREYPWRPPLNMTVRAHFSHPAEKLRGTAGFGFWNQPFMPGGQGWPRLPRAVWFFFGSPPNNMALAKGVPGYGWKAATFDAMTPGFFGLLPFAPLGFLLMRIPALYERFWPLGQRAIRVSECLLSADLAIPHTYTLIWQMDGVDFSVDGEPVHHAPYAPGGPLGFIAWIDNQYAVVTPQGRFGFGYLPLAEEQWLAIDLIEIKGLVQGAQNPVGEEAVI